MIDPDIKVLVNIVANSIVRDDVSSDIAKKAIIELVANFLINHQCIADAMERIAYTLEKNGRF
jgi:hypothetical protein